jgi:hypothetical protein
MVRFADLPQHILKSGSTHDGLYWRAGRYILGSFRLLPRHARFLPYGMTVCTVVSSLFSPDFIALNVTESLVTPWFDISDGLRPFPHGMTVCTVVYV